MWDKLLAYGKGPAKLCEDLNGEGVKITIEETKEIFDKYMRTFHTTIDWLNTQKRTASKEFFMANALGRRRYWFRPNKEKIKLTAEAEAPKLFGPKFEKWQLDKLIEDKTRAHIAAVEREGANFQIQSINVEMTKASMASIRKRCKQRGYDARMYNSVYDEIVVDTAESCAQEVHELHKQTMIEEANKILKRVPMTVDGHLQPYWTK